MKYPIILRIPLTNDSRASLKTRGHRTVTILSLDIDYAFIRGITSVKSSKFVGEIVFIALVNDRVNVHRFNFGTSK